MPDEEIVAKLQDARGALGPVALALLVESEIGRRLSEGELITYFKRAFPEIPLTTLYEASRWHRLGSGELDDAAFEKLLGQWCAGSGRFLRRK